MSALMKCSGTFMCIFLFWIHSLKVDVQHLQLERMHLHVPQQHLLLLTLHIHGQDGSMEGFQLELLVKVVVVQLDGLRRILSAVNDARHSAGTPQAAARTFALQFALFCADFYLHCFLQNMDHPRPDDPVDKKLNL